MALFVIIAFRHALERVDRRKHQVEAEIDEVDTRDRNRRLTREHDALVQKAVDELEKRGLI